MKEPRWPNDIPPPHAALYTLGQHCLDQVNRLARESPPTTMFEHELLDITRTLSLAITTLSKEYLALRKDVEDTQHYDEAFDEPMT